MIRFLTLVLASASLLSVSCAQMKKKGECSSCCDSSSKPGAAACCDSKTPHKH